MTDYPNLGFDPAPGMPESVESLRGQVKSAVDAMGEAGHLMSRLRNANDTVWRGEAGNAFREHFDGKLGEELDKAHESLGKAVGVIQQWHTDLVDFKDTANKLEAEAGEARREQKQAETELQQAKANPDLKLAGQRFDSDAALQQAQSKLDAAEAAVNKATAKAEAAADKLDSIIRRAKELQANHEDVARKAAAKLKDAIHNLAPEEPGLFDKIGDALTAVGDWVKTHLDDIHAVLATVSAVSGLIALCTPPPVDAIALGVSVVAGAGALATDLADPEFRAGIGDLLQGDFSGRGMKALMTGIGDVASVIPGATLGFKAVTNAVPDLAKVAGSADDMRRFGQLASEVAHTPGLAVKGMSHIPGANALGDAATAADNVLSHGLKATQIDAVDRLNLLWRGTTVGTNLYKDVELATS